MKKKITKENIIALVSNSLKINKKKINLKTTSKNIDKWDSLGNIKIMFSIEKKYGIKIPQNKMTKLNSIISILDIIRKSKI